MEENPHDRGKAAFDLTMFTFAGCKPQKWYCVRSIMKTWGWCKTLNLRWHNMETEQSNPGQHNERGVWATKPADQLSEAGRTDGQQGWGPDSCCHCLTAGWTRRAVSAPFLDTAPLPTTRILHTLQLADNVVKARCERLTSDVAVTLAS